MEEELKELRRRGKEVPPELKERIVLAHLSLVRFIVNRVGARLPVHMDLDDLYNIGIIGLLDAIDKFNADKDVKFKTYAEFRIKGSILDELRGRDWLPRRVRGKQRRVKQAYREVEQRLGRPADADEVADALGVTLEKFHAIQDETIGTYMTNLDEMRGRGKDGEDVGSYHDFLEDTRAESPLDLMANAELSHAVKAALATLPEAEKTVLSLYFYSGLSEDRIGIVLGVTESRVAQIMVKALKRLEHRRDLEKHAN